MDCIFCKIINGDIPSYTIYEDDYVKCFLDINPMSMGHTLIIPKKHFLDINDIDEEYLTKVMMASKKIVSILDEKFNPDGIRIVQNNGNLQEVKHYHVHVVPNYIKKRNKKVEEVFKTIVK